MPGTGRVRAGSGVPPRLALDGERHRSRARPPRLPSLRRHRFSRSSLLILPFLLAPGAFLRAESVVNLRSLSLNLTWARCTWFTITTPTVRGEAEATLIAPHDALIPALPLAPADLSLLAMRTSYPS